MKIKITRTRVLEIVSGAESLKQLSGVKLAYAVSKNMTALKREQESINEELEKYREEYSAILEAEAKKDEHGNFIPVGNGQVAIANFATFKAKTNALNKKYAKQLEKQKVDEKEFEKFLKEPFEFEFFQFEESLLPETITVEQIGLLDEMIKSLP